MTAKVVHFPTAKARKVPRQNRPKPGWYLDESEVVPRERWRAYRLGDLAGARPRGHPKVIPRGPRGGIRLTVGQVWVDLHGETLWVIRYLEPQAQGRYRVHLSLYERDEISYELSSLTLKQIMKIWDEAASFFRGAVEHMKKVAFLRGGDPIKAAKFFGVDPQTGERTND